MQTILGAGGALGIELAKALSAYTDEIRIVSRNPKKVNGSDELFPADLSDGAEVDRAIGGSEIVYLTIGFAYKLKLWQSSWPRLMGEVIDSCKKHGSKLVFFDNMYMYDKNAVPHMREDSPINPEGEKGKVRAEIAGMILSEVEKGKLTALIARSADFYGPHSNNNITRIIYNDLLKGKKASWIAHLGKLHNFTYIPDAGKATALLGNTPDAYSQVWHLPSNHEKMNGKQWIDAIAKEMNVTPKYRVLPTWLMAILGLFMPEIRELKEISYQSDRDYFFDSSKFEKRFNLYPTPVETGIRETIKSYRQE